jgi:hypothetical protein
MISEALMRYQSRIKALQVGKSLLVPWFVFIGPKPKTTKQKAISDGKMVWILTPQDNGIEVKRIE